MSEKAGTASVLITQAAKQTLGPIGLIQKGGSRIWLGDRGWCLDVVEFQPSSSSQGSYLNVSCMWLWNVKPYISFDTEIIRKEGHFKFEDEQQFDPIAQMLAKKAAGGVNHHRALFPTVSALSDYYVKNPPATVFWPTLNAAVSHGLAGRGDVGHRMIAGVIGKLDSSIAWQKQADADAVYIASIIQEQDQFRSEMTERVQRTRELHELPQMDLAF
jgi:hypothetical protein